MKTLRYREANNVKPGILDKEGKIRDASSLVRPVPPSFSGT